MFLSQGNISPPVHNCLSMQYLYLSHMKKRLIVRQHLFLTLEIESVLTTNLPFG